MQVLIISFLVGTAFVPIGIVCLVASRSVRL